jgi:FO synthase subunit 2
LSDERTELHAVVVAADELRRRQVGDIVTYVVNRNVNFTNVCVKHCGFCAFSRTYRSEQGYFLPREEILRRIQEAADMGATEVCMQAGLPPDMDGAFYIELTAAVKKVFLRYISTPSRPKRCYTARRSPVYRSLTISPH